MIGGAVAANCTGHETFRYEHVIMFTSLGIFIASLFSLITPSCDTDSYSKPPKTKDCSLLEKWTKSSNGERADLIIHLTRLYLSPGRDPHEINEDTAFIIGMINSAVRRENDNLKARCKHLQKQLDECECNQMKQKREVGKYDTHTIIRDFMTRINPIRIFMIANSHLEGSTMKPENFAVEWIKLNDIILYTPKEKESVPQWITDSSIRINTLISCIQEKDTEPTKTECITTKNSEKMKDLRKCEFELNGEFVDGFFHKWEKENAIVEDRKGRCHLIEMNKVRFTDFIRDTVDKVLGR
jgi:hypothetical protein